MGWFNRHWTGLGTKKQQYSKKELQEQADKTQRDQNRRLKKRKSQPPIKGPKGESDKHWLW